MAAISNEEFQDLLKRLPTHKLEKVKKYTKELSEEKNFENGMDFLFKNYSKTLEGLKDR